MEEREIPGLEMWGTVQKSMENDRSHLGMCCIECHVRCKFRLRADVTYMSLFWPWVSKTCFSVEIPVCWGRRTSAKCSQGIVTWSWVLGRATVSLQPHSEQCNKQTSCLCV